MPAESVVEKKHGQLHELWRHPPHGDEYAITAGIVMILKTLQDLMQSHDEAETEEIRRNLEIITTALRVIEDLSPKMKVAQTGGVIAAMRVLYDFVSSKDQYLDELQQLSQSFAQIHITEEAASRWQDLAEWMWALHQVTADAAGNADKDEKGLVKPLDDGTYPHIDAGDSVFKTATRGISKYSLIRHYGIASNHIHDGLVEFQNRSTPRLVKK